MQFTRASCREVKDDILAALKQVEAKHGITFTAGNGRFDATQFGFKLTANVVGSDGTDLAAKTDFDRTCYLYGLEPKHYLAEFKYAGMRFRLDGFNHRARSYPLKCTNLDDLNDRRKLPQEAVAIIKLQATA